MKKDRPQPLFRTPDDQLNKVEKYKLASNMTRGHLHEEFRNLATGDLSDESEQLAKSHGIYLEYNRAATGREKDWMYMVRISIPGGGGLTRDHWRLFDELSQKYTTNPDGQPSLRVTTRQNVQFHWVRKPHVIEIVRTIAQTGFYSLNGCGDNTRNVMACPLTRFSTVCGGHELARQFGAYFRLPAEPHIQIFEIDTRFLRTPGSGRHFEYGPKLLNRKFKIAVSAVHRAPDGRWFSDNCVECRTNEIGVCPVVDPKRDKVVAYQLFIGGGQGEKNGKPTFAALGKPFGVFTPENLLKGMDAIVKVHQEWGDRKNRHWARMKYVVHELGIPWYQDQVRALGATFDEPIPGFDPGPRMLHHGWHEQPDGRLAFGCYIENGRLIDGDNGRLKSMVRHLMDSYPIELLTTPNQDLLFTNIPPDAKQRFENDLASFGHGRRHGKPYSKLRVLSGACVGLYTCRLSYAESEQFEPELIDQLEAMGYGSVSESIGITGCERQCFRPATKSIGWIGQGPDLYALKIGGSEDARHQGQYLSDGQRWFLRQVPRGQVAHVTAALFDHHAKNRLSSEEDLGAFLRRLGAAAVIEYLSSNPVTAALMKKTYDSPYVPEDNGKTA